MDVSFPLCGVLTLALGAVPLPLPRSPPLLFPLYLLYVVLLSCCGLVVVLTDVPAVDATPVD